MFRCFATALPAAVAASMLSATCAAAPPPIDAFARSPAMRSPSISPNGALIAFISGVGDRSVVFVSKRRSTEPANAIFGADSDKFDLSWCNWANDTRLLCGLEGMSVDVGHVFPITRLVGVNADGSGLKVLMQRTTSTQFEDRILDWTPDEPDTVLIQLDDDEDGFPSVFELNVMSGRIGVRVHQQKPIRAFVTDAKGNVRFATGYNQEAELYYFARLENESEWRKLAKIKAFSGASVMKPVAAAPGTNKAYARGAFEGRSALWEMDLTDKLEPQLVFSHPLVDVEAPLFTPDGRLLGIRYELDRPFIYYTDAKVGSLIKAVNKLRPDTFNSIIDYTRDERAFLIHSYSDVDGGTYHLLDMETKQLEKLGTRYPELDPQQLGRMRSIVYKAADGTEIPGYLTVPPGVRAEQLPLVVMPHGGPIARDSWGFDFLRAFLVSRGYAVLQMNFRGSDGYGSDWFYAAHQDWGGLTYSDITDGARWAVAKGVADPKRMCIVGWSFGGYAALLGAARNGDLYKCAVSIAGVSDLQQLVYDERFFVSGSIAREQIGTQRDKLREDSPLRHVDTINMPVLLVHGDRDYQVDVDHSRRMNAALKKAGKPHRAVIIPNATHQLQRQSERITLLTEVEKFLLDNLGPGATPTP